MRKLTAFAAGLVFGLGLVISDMANPARVKAFFDFAGDWDPTLAFVMGGGVVVSFLGLRLAARRGETLLGGPLPKPPAEVIDRNLILGSVLFGIGWAIAGICPGPSVVALATGQAGFFVFLAAMLAGMALWNLRLSQALARVPA